jgi:hypothetical protein
VVLWAQWFLLHSPDDAEVNYDGLIPYNRIEFTQSDTYWRMQHLKTFLKKYPTADKNDKFQL